MVTVLGYWNKLKIPVLLKKKKKGGGGGAHKTQTKKKKIKETEKF